MKTTSATRMAKWRAANIELARAKGRAYRAAHPEKRPDKKAAAERTRKWRAANPGKARALARAAYAANPERYRSYGRKKRGLPLATRPCPTHCEVCARPAIKTLHLDHDHTTGAFRGWLCGSCNRGIGIFRDSADLLLHAAVYLERNRTVQS